MGKIEKTQQHRIKSHVHKIIGDLLCKGRTDPPLKNGADQKKLKTFF